MVTFNMISPSTLSQGDSHESLKGGHHLNRFTEGNWPCTKRIPKGALRTSVGMLLKYGTRVYHLLARDCRAVLIGHSEDYKKHA